MNLAFIRVNQRTGANRPDLLASGATSLSVVTALRIICNLLPGATFGCIYRGLFRFARVAELADALDLGSSAQWAWRFESSLSRCAKTRVFGLRAGSPYFFEPPTTTKRPPISAFAFAFDLSQGATTKHNTGTSINAGVEKSAGVGRCQDQATESHELLGFGPTRLGKLGDKCLNKKERSSRVSPNDV